MRNLLSTVPNQITAARLVLIVVMWVFAWLRLPVYIGIGILAACISDTLDGFIARRLNQTSELGSKFDSLADNILLPSAVIWLGLLRPEVFQENTLISVIAVMLYASALLLGLLKFKRYANLHLYSSRAASVPMYVFMIHALIAEHYEPILFYVAVGLFAISSTERLLIELTFSKVDEHMGSAFLAWRRGDQRANGGKV